MGPVLRSSILKLGRSEPGLGLGQELVPGTWNEGKRPVRSECPRCGGFGGVLDSTAMFVGGRVQLVFLIGGTRFWEIVTCERSERIHLESSSKQ